jgi:hypothetical protein
LKWELPALIAPVNAQDTQLLIEIRIGSSGDLPQSFDRREIVRLHAGRGDGELPAEEKFGCVQERGVRLTPSPATGSGAITGQRAGRIAAR